MAAAGGIGFAAHPFSDGVHMRWPALEDPVLTGIELWSFLTDAAEHWSTPARRCAGSAMRSASSTRGRQAMSQTGTGSLPSAGSPRAAAWTRTMRVSGCADACAHRFPTAACSRS